MRSCRLKTEVTYPLRFRNLNSPCTRISTHIDAYEPSEDEYGLFMANSMTYVFGLLPVAIKHKHGVSIPFLDAMFIPNDSLLNLSKKILRISPARNIVKT